jgi:hypothetical protein
MKKQGPPPCGMNRLGWVLLDGVVVIDGALAGLGRVGRWGVGERVKSPSASLIARLIARMIERGDHYEQLRLLAFARRSQ